MAAEGDKRGLNCYLNTQTNLCVAVLVTGCNGCWNDPKVSYCVATSAFANTILLCLYCISCLPKGIKNAFCAVMKAVKSVFELCGPTKPEQTNEDVERTSGKSD